MVKEILRKSQMKSGVSLKTRVIKDKTVYTRKKKHVKTENEI